LKPKTNEDRLVEISVLGEVTPPPAGRNPWAVHAESGKVASYPSVGGIVYGIRTGDSCIDIEADHVEAGVSVSYFGQTWPNNAGNYGLNLYACVGNVATVINGGAKGKKGAVTGKHGGIEHVLVDFDEKTKDKLVIGDKMQIRAKGVGLKFTNFDGVSIMNASPALVSAMALNVKGGKLEVPVTHVIPAKIMGSGLGATSAASGDYDIQMFDEAVNKEYKLGTLRFGDIVAITDADSTYGRIFRTGAITVGVVVHSICHTAGHGPGVCTLFASTEGRIKPIVDKDANLKFILGLK